MRLRGMLILFHIRLKSCETLLLSDQGDVFVVWGLECEQRAWRYCRGLLLNSAKVTRAADVTLLLRLCHGTWNVVLPAPVSYKQ